MKYCCSSFMMFVFSVIGLFSAATRTYAVESPETLLPEDCVAYFCFDGIAAHREALDRTTLAQLLAEDLKPLFDHVKQLVIDSLGSDVVSERLLAGAEPDSLIGLQKASVRLPALLEFLSDHGFLLGVEPIGLPIPGVRVTLVFPQGNQPRHREAIFAGVQLLASLEGSKLEVVEVGDRTIRRIEIKDGFELGCWPEGEHMVVTVGNSPIGKSFPMNRGQRKDITASPLLTDLNSWDEYETYARGFVDVQRVLEFVKRTIPPAAPLVEQLGVADIRSLSLRFGCHEDLQRTTILLETQGKRRGVLAPLAATANVSLDGLPPLPPDASTVQALGVEPVTLLDGSLEVIRLLLKTTAPDELDDFEKQYRQFERDIGVDLRDDVATALGSTVVAATSSIDGAFFVGTSFMVEVKDEAKLRKTFQRLMQAVSDNYSDDVVIRTRPYRNGELYLLNAVDPSDFPLTPAAAIHDGWLVVGFTHQVAQGLILRSSGKFRTWSPTELMQTAIAQAKEVSGDDAKVFFVNQLDPRPTVTTLISLSTFFGVFAGAMSDEPVKFDFSLVPNAQAITEQLRPNVVVGTDNGRIIRFDGHASLPLMVDLTGYSNLLFLSGPFSFFNF